MNRILIIFGISVGVLLALGALWGRFDLNYVAASVLTGGLAAFIINTVLTQADQGKAARTQINSRRSLAATAYDAILGLNRAGWKSGQNEHIILIQVVQPGLAFEDMKNAEWWGVRQKDFWSGRLRAHADTLTALRRAGVIQEDPLVDRILLAAVMLNGPDFKDDEIIAIIGEIRDAAEASARQNSPPA